MYPRSRFISKVKSNLIGFLQERWKMVKLSHRWTCMSKSQRIRRVFATWIASRWRAKPPKHRFLTKYLRPRKSIQCSWDRRAQMTQSPKDRQNAYSYRNSWGSSIIKRPCFKRRIFAKMGPLKTFWSHSYRSIQSSSRIRITSILEKNLGRMIQFRQLLLRRDMLQNLTRANLMIKKGRVHQKMRIVAAYHFQISWPEINSKFKRASHSRCRGSVQKMYPWTLKVLEAREPYKTSLPKRSTFPGSLPTQWFLIPTTSTSMTNFCKSSILTKKWRHRQLRVHRNLAPARD